MEVEETFMNVSWGKENLIPFDFENAGILFIDGSDYYH